MKKSVKSNGDVGHIDFTEEDLNTETSQKEEIVDVSNGKEVISNPNLNLNLNPVTKPVVHGTNTGPQVNDSTDPLSEGSTMEPAPTQAFTLICFKTIRGEICTEARCLFAHDVDQLKPVLCRYGDECYNPKNCRFYHEFLETKERYYQKLVMLFKKNKFGNKKKRSGSVSTLTRIPISTPTRQVVIPQHATNTLIKPMNINMTTFQNKAHNRSQNNVNVKDTGSIDVNNENIDLYLDFVYRINREIHLYFKNR